jgi:hypothetical protein
VRKSYNIQVGKLQEKEPFVIPSNRQTDNMEMTLKNTAGEGMSWIEVAQERPNDKGCETVMEVDVNKAGNSLTS